MKNKLKKMMAVMLGVVCISAVSITSYAENGGDEICYDEVAPAYSGISTTYTNLTKNSNGSLGCMGTTLVNNGCNAGIVAELQQYNGGWTTIKTWEYYDADYAFVDADWFVVSGYSYRLKTTHYAYDSSWNQIDSVVKYSDTLYK